MPWKKDRVPQREGVFQDVVNCLEQLDAWNSAVKINIQRRKHIEIYFGIEINYFVNKLDMEGKCKKKKVKDKLATG